MLIFISMFLFVKMYFQIEILVNKNHETYQRKLLRNNQSVDIKEKANKWLWKKINVMCTTNEQKIFFDKIM